MLVAENETQDWLSPASDAMPKLTAAVLVFAPVMLQVPCVPAPGPFTNTRLMLDCTVIDTTSELVAVVCPCAPKVAAIHKTTMDKAGLR